MDWGKIEKEVNNDFKKIKRTVLVVIAILILVFSLFVKESLPGGNAYATKGTSKYPVFFDEEIANLFKDFKIINFNHMGKAKSYVTYFFEISPNELDIRKQENLDLLIQKNGWTKKNNIKGNSEDYMLMYCKNKSLLGIRAPKTISNSYMATNNWIIFLKFNRDTALETCSGIE